MKRYIVYVMCVALFALWVGGGIKALDYGSGGGSGGGTTITGGACTNQVMTALDTAGLPTCASTTNAMLAGSIDLSTKVTGILPSTSHPALSGDISTSSGAVVTTIGAAKVTNAMLAGSIAFAKLIGSDITALGTIATGVWQGTVVAAIYGGTGQSSYTVGDILTANTTTSLSKVAAPAVGQVWGSAGVGVVPAWTTHYVLPKTSFNVREEFMNSTTTAGQIGGLGWAIRTIGGAPTLTYIDGVWPYLGAVHIANTGTTAQGGQLSLDASSTGPLGNMAAYTWDSYWTFRIPTTTTVRVRVGFGQGTGSGSTEPTDGIWIRYDTNAGFADTNYMCVNRASSSSSATDTTVAVTTGWHTIRLRSTAAGTTRCSIDGGTEIVSSTSVPTLNMSPMAIVTNDANASRTLDLDFFSFEATGLTR